MEEHDDTPTEKPQPTGEPTPEPSPPPPPPPPGSEPRKLFRSREDKVIAGVCSGLGRYFGVDPVIFRIATIALVFVGGAGILLYLAAMLLIPLDDGTARLTLPEGGRTQALTVAGVVVLAIAAFAILAAAGAVIGWILFPLAFLVAVGLLAWWIASGKRPDGSPTEILKRAALGLGLLFGSGCIALAGAWAAGTGGGTVAAILVIVSGAVLVAAAFYGGARWFIMPALALGLAAGFVTAAGIDLDGGIGKKEFRPATAADVHRSYQLGVGELIVDLRGAKLPAGDNPVKIKVGVGHALLLVPRNVCVATEAAVGMGAIDVFNRDSGGIDVNFDDNRVAPPTTPRVVLNGQMGLGLIEVRHTSPPSWNRGDRNGNWDRTNEPGNFACIGGRAGVGTVGAGAPHA